MNEEYNFVRRNHETVDFHVHMHTANVYLSNGIKRQFVSYRFASATELSEWLSIAFLECAVRGFRMLS